MAESQAIAVRSSNDIAQLSELENALRTGITPDIEERDPAEVSAALIDELLRAESDEELERPRAESFRDFEEVPFEVQSFSWHPSSFEDGHAVFLAVKAIDLRDGRLRVLTTGSGQVMAQLVNRAKRGTLPATLELRGDDTKKGNRVYWLATPEAVAEQRRQDALEEAKAREAAEQAAEEN